MNLSEYIPKSYLLIELPYSKVIMDHPEAIQLEKPVGAFIVPQEVWINAKAEFTINQMKQSGELTSTLAADGTEWLDCPNAIPSAPLASIVPKFNRACITKDSSSEIF